MHGLSNARFRDYATRREGEYQDSSVSYIIGDDDIIIRVVRLHK